MDTKISDLLSELKAGLRALYGSRLRGVYVYGSYARGGAGSESDLDILIVLDTVSWYAAEVNRTGTLIASLSLKYSLSVSRVLVGEEDWSHAQSPFLLNAREEAIAA